MFPIAGQSFVEADRFPRRNGFWFLLAFRDLISEYLLPWYDLVLRGLGHKLTALLEPKKPEARNED